MAVKKSLHLILPLNQLSVFFPMLQQGVWLRVQAGCSVTNLLTEQFGVAETYVIERITTLFLDNKPIDDLEQTYVKDGSTLALSSAMPGLVGTTMRRGGHLAAMRGTITHQSQKQELSGTGRVKIKLFNMVMAELGEKILSYGIYLSNCDLGNFLSEQEDSFWQSFGMILLDGQQIDPAGLKEHVRSAVPADEFLVKLEFRE